MLLFAHLGLTLLSGRFMRWADMAFLALGSMLPDIIDKPLGLLAFGTPAAGRTICHTLLFLLVLGALAVYLKDFRVASVFAGVLAHFTWTPCGSRPSSCSGHCWETFPWPKISESSIICRHSIRPEKPHGLGARGAGTGLSDLLSHSSPDPHSRQMGDFASLLLEYGGCAPDSAQRQF